MSSGGKPTTTTTTNNAPPAWAIPYFQRGLNLAEDAATKPYTPYTGQVVAGMTPDQVTAMNMTRQNAVNGGVVNTGEQFAQGMLGGKGQFQAQANPYTGKTGGTNAYAGSNPHLTNMIGAANKDITSAFTDSTMPNMMAQFNSGGAYGGTAMADSMSQAQQNLAEQLSDTSNQFRFQDYTQQQQLAENALGRQQTDLSRNAQLADSLLGRQQSAWGDHQGRQMQALGMAPQLDQASYYGGQQLYGMGQQGQLNNQAGLDAAYDQWQQGQNWDMDRLGSLSNMLGAVQGGSSSSTGANPNYRSAGQNALTAAAIVASFFV